MTNNRKRNVAIHIRVTKDEKKRIVRNAMRCRLTVSEYLRQLANGYHPTELPLDEIYGISRRIEECCDGRSDLLESVNDLRRICLGLYLSNKKEPKTDGNDKNMEGNG